MRRAPRPRVPRAGTAATAPRAFAATLALATALGLAASAAAEPEAEAGTGGARAAEGSEAAEGEAAPAAEEGTAGALRLELNKLEPREGACRVYLVLENGLTDSLEELRLDLVLFGGDGVILRRLAVDAGPLGVGRTRVRLFDVEEVGCERIGRLLLNGVLACQDSEGEPLRCSDRLELRSRTETPFER